MNITNLARYALHSRVKSIDSYARYVRQIQHNVLSRLIQRASQTEYALKTGFAESKDYEAFRRNAPLTTYEDIKADIDRMRHGEKNILWPGQIKCYAKSSGTTNDKSKFIPVSKEGLKNIHYAGGRDAVALYLSMNPKSRFFSGKSLILGGSHSPNYNLTNSFVGDLSAIMIENLPAFARHYQMPKKETALLSDFELKRELIAEQAIRSDVTSLSGVPSWMLSVLEKVLEKSGKQNISQLWPNLEVFFHGGIAFAPYRATYHRLIPHQGMQYVETYNASEGFFGIQNELADPAMMLMIDYDIFYEFIPMSQYGKQTMTAVPLEDVETDTNYAIVITTSCGLWRYIIGDTIKFTQKNPYKFIITGRTKNFINAFGEELIVDNAEKALEAACETTGAVVSDYTAAPVFMDHNAKCRHQWLIEFTTPPADLSQFEALLDAQLQSINSDYEAKRYKNITLQQLEIVQAEKGLFQHWLKLKNKLGGQHKIPRLENDRHIIDELLELNAELNASTPSAAG